MFFFFLIILSVVKICTTVQLGQIQNASWVFNSLNAHNTYTTIVNITCDQCLCQMLSVNNLTVTISCQETLRTCQLVFWNATAQLQTNETSVVYFQTIPSFLQSSTTSTTLTTSTTSTTTTTTTTTTSTTSTSTSTTTTSTTSTSTTTAVPVLLINPGGELGVLSPWIASSSTSPILVNGTVSGSTVQPHNGSFSFYGANGGSLRQKVLLNNTFSTVQLDTGQLNASISFWQYSANDNDKAKITLGFLSSSNQYISNVSTAITSCRSTWCYVTGTWKVPATTRMLDYVMEFIRSGSNCRAWIDDNTLTVV